MIKSYTDLEQSKKLSKILPIESADMHYVMIDTDEDKYDAGLGKYIGILPHYPCWSLAALLGVLPEGIIENYYVPNLQKENGKYSIAYGNDELLCMANNPVDTCYEMVIKLHEQKLI